MSLGDELRILRAKTGGPTPFDIEEATGVDAGIYRQLEQRYREMGDDETLEKLAAYFGCDTEMLKQARSRSRKALTRQLELARRSKEMTELHLRTGETFRGRVTWWDLGSIGFELEDGQTLVVIQRHSVVDW